MAFSSKETVFGQGEEKSSVKKLESDENRPEIKKETKNALAVMFPDSDSSSSASASDSESSSEASQSSSDDSFGLNSEDDLPLLDTVCYFPFFLLSISRCFAHLAE